MDMDVNLVLHEIRELTVKIANFEGESYDAHLLAEKVDALDNWMSKGGFAPDAWRETEDHR
jgi:hypothetical protein